MLGLHEHVDADAEQDAGQQCGGNAGRQRAHQLVEPAGHAGGGHQHGRHDKGADGLRVGHARQAGDQQGGARRGPGHDDGRPRQQGQPDGGHSHADGQRPDPRGDLRVRQMGRLAGLDHQHQRTGVAGQHGDQPGDQGGDGEIGQLQGSGGHGAGHGTGTRRNACGKSGWAAIFARVAPYWPRAQSATLSLGNLKESRSR